MKIVVDAFGGDFAPLEIVRGAVKALQADEKLEVVLVGDKDRITEALQQIVYVSDRLEIVHAPDVVGEDENPITAIKNKKTSSIVVAYDYLKKNKSAMALVSAGIVGATLAAANNKLDRINNVEKLAFAPLINTIKGSKTMILDCGANTECDAEILVKYALMANEYMKAYGVKNPKVALLNAGIGEQNGNDEYKKAYQKLTRSKINFVGNIEARDILRGNVDIIVCDGFSGNVCLKCCEGVAEIIFDEIRESVGNSARAKVAAFMLRKKFKSVKNRYDYTLYGGAPILGCNKIILKCHGASKADAICDTILKANMLVKAKLIDKIVKALG